ncbi:MAG: bacillithiol biosynthesis cysteine-adding enzyme BshC [Chitinophagaceae bacterium]
MKVIADKIPYAETRFFSNLVLDYLKQKEELLPFIQAFPSLDSLKHQILLKEKENTDRAVLVEVLNEQYQSISNKALVSEQIATLNDTNTMAIVTAHQPLIFTGHLYFIYKIVHAIVLSRFCKKYFPNYHFVPIFFIGSEDDDIEEIGTLDLGTRSFKWQATQKGPCGSMTLESLQPILKEVLSYFNTNDDEIKKMHDLIQRAYQANHTLSEATRLVLHELFGQEGLVVLDANHIKLKKSFSHVIKNELLHFESHKIVSHTISQMPSNYSIQAHSREINFFYMKDGLRERIVFEESVWKVLNTTIVFTKEALLQEISESPNHFSPNVILRPLYQETILPSIAFVGGGAEVAYWMLLKNVFEYYQVQFPILFLRNSVAVSLPQSSKRVDKYQFTLQDIFTPIEQLKSAWSQEQEEYKTLEKSLKAIQVEYQKIISEAGLVNKNLRESTLAQVKKIEKLHARILEKNRFHIKQKNQTRFEQIEKIQREFFPNRKLQERDRNFIELFLELKTNFIKACFEHQQAMNTNFLVLSFFTEEK